MGSNFFWYYCLPLLMCWFGSAALEFFFKPKLRPLWQRSYLAIFIQLTLLSVIYVTLLIVTQRPLFSMGGCLCLIFIVLVINNVKYSTLREPLAFSDFFLYLQIFQHPRFYLPFLGQKLLVLLVIVCGCVIFAGFSLEEASFSLLSVEAFCLLSLLFLMLFLLSRLCLRTVISIDLETDCEQFGVLATACIYAYRAPKLRETLYQSIIDESAISVQEIHKVTDDKTLADIVVVQSESFFDARSIDPNILETVLSEYDECLHSSEMFGKLKVPAWGANTMRTEFGFLTGLKPEQLGLAQFYPYQQLVEMKLPSIVSELKSLGYHCICIHPNAANFFMRDKFFKQLGFDEFLDEKSFGSAVREGPYIADEAVTDKIIQVLKDKSKPHFIFAITMENHGPLHLETLEENEWIDYYKKSPDVRLNDLTIYLRHLKNADKMISRLCEFFTKRNIPVLFSLYGDHVPAISDVFEFVGYNDPRSNYFIWSNKGSDSTDQSGFSKETELKIEMLGKELLDRLVSQPD